MTLITASAAENCCPGCDETDGVEQTTATPHSVAAWTCTRCGMNWAVTLVNHGQRAAYFEQLAATVEEIGRLRWLLRQVVILADDAPRLSDDQLRDRLAALARLSPTEYWRARSAHWQAHSAITDVTKLTNACE